MLLSFQEQKGKQMSQKIDVINKPTKSEVIADLKRQLQEAQKKLQQKITVKDTKAVERLKVIISSLEATLARQN